MKSLPLILFVSFLALDNHSFAADEASESFVTKNDAATVVTTNSENSDSHTKIKLHFYNEETKELEEVEYVVGFNHLIYESTKTDGSVDSNAPRRVTVNHNDFLYTTNAKVTDSIYFNQTTKNSIDQGANISNRDYVGISLKFSALGSKEERIVEQFITQSSPGGAAIGQSFLGDIEADFVSNQIIEDAILQNSKNKTITKAIGGGSIYLDSDSKGAIGNIIGNFLNNRVESYRNSVDGGAIHLVSSTIDSITGDFIKNWVKFTTKDGFEPTKDNSGRAWGGAIYISSANKITDDQVNVEPGTIGNITGNFIGNYADSDRLGARGGAIYSHHEAHDKETGDRLQNVGNITGDFLYNYVSSSSEEDPNPDDTIGYNSIGGAIYNGDGSIMGTIKGDFIGNYAKNINNASSGGAIANTTQPNDTTEYVSEEGGKIQEIIGRFYSNYAISENGAAQGGAIGNGTRQDGYSGGTIENIEALFDGNYVKSTNGRARGGAIYNGNDTQNIADAYLGGKITNITADFIANQAESDADKALGGAIYNAYGDIDKITGNFYFNTATGGDGGRGGALANTRAGHIVEVSGEFRGNTATSNGGEASFGGAIYNTNGAEDNPNIAENLKDPSRIGRFGQRTEIVDKGRYLYEDDADEHEYNGTLVGGIVNSSFYNNEAEGEDSHGGAIWTDSKISIVAEDGFHSVFSGNKADNESSGLYIAKEDAEVYLVATKDSGITFDDVIEGTLKKALQDEPGVDLSSAQDKEVSTLRLRGGRAYANTPVQGGGIYLNNAVKNVHVLMDDVTLYLGTSNEHNPEHDGQVDKTRVDHTAAAVESYNVEKDSYILENANLTTQSGVVNTIDSEATNYFINKLTAYGRPNSRYGLTGDATIDNVAPLLYSTYAIDILIDRDTKADHYVEVTNDAGKTTQAKAERSDVFTVGKGSTGYITLAQISVDQVMKYLGEGEEKGREGEGGYGYDPEERNGSLNNYEDIYVQIINYTGDDAAQYKEKNDKIIQLDISGLNIVKYEEAHMTSADVLAKGIEYGTVNTYHDSIHLVGWRDPLAAWAELDDAVATGEDTAPHKSFTILAGHTQTLTRNINIEDNDDKHKDEHETGPLMTGNDLRIIGAGVISTLNVNHKNMMTQIGEEQTVRLQNLLLTNVQKDTTLNNGNLILDTLYAYNASGERVALTIDNQVKDDHKLTVTGNSTINYIITTKDADAQNGAWGTMLIDDSSKVTDKSVILIKNEVSNQNITHAAQTGDWKVTDTGADQDGGTIHTFDFDSSTITHLYTTAAGSSAATYEFTHFTNNSLDMQGGMFHLHDMYTHRLQLRDFNINHGAVYVQSATVNLQKRLMGGIDALNDTVDADALGLIWLGGFEITEDTSRLITHVKFVDENVGTLVKDWLGIAQNGKDSMVIMEAAKYRYRVTYANDEKVDVTARADKAAAEAAADKGAGQADEPVVQADVEVETNEAEVPADHIRETGISGYYTFERIGMSSRLYPGSVTQQAGVIPTMLLVYDYAFQHAELYADSIYAARQAQLYERSYAVVTPVKGAKEYAGAVSASPAPQMPSSAGMKGGMWLRPYISFENLPLHNGPKVDATLYGALVGFDTDLTEYSSGWASVFTGYLGYNGGRLRWDGYTTTTNGALIGVTETFYKNNFFTAITATVGFTAGDTRSRYGSEDYNMITAGIASRTGYNIVFENGKYVLQPAIQLSYTLGLVDSYTNADGIQMKSDPMHAIQIHPMLKFIKHTESEWKPYLVGGMVWTLMGKTRFKAEGEKLPGMSIRPYVEYGVGIQKTWKDTYTFFSQLTGRSLGRQGVELSAGIRWAW